MGRIPYEVVRKAETPNRNPLKFLHRLSKEKLRNLSMDKGFLFKLQKVWEKFQHYLQHAGTFRDLYADQCHFDKNEVIAYFSMEFGLHESAHIYAGGLGVLAGDFLKDASDLRVNFEGGYKSQAMRNRYR